MIVYVLFPGKTNEETLGKLNYLVAECRVRVLLDKWLCFHNKVVNNF